MLEYSLVTEQSDSMKLALQTPQPQLSIWAAAGVCHLSTTFSSTDIFCTFSLNRVPTKLTVRKLSFFGNYRHYGEKAS